MKTLLFILAFSPVCCAQMILDGNMKTQSNIVFGNPTPTTISTWGDSITSGMQDGYGDSYPSDLKLILNRYVLNGGISGQTSHEILDRFQAAPSQWNNTTIICAGGNDYWQESSVLANIATMVTSLTSTRFLTMSIFSGQDSPSGSLTYNEIVTDNAAINAAYPNHYFDARSFLVAQYDPSNGADVANHALDMTPFTMRAVIQRGTLTAALTDTTSCPVLSVPLTETYETIAVDSEYIVEITYTTNTGTVLTCTRGWGSTATTHASAAAYTASDAIHPNRFAYALMAQQIAQFMVNNSY